MSGWLCNGTAPSIQQACKDMAFPILLGHVLQYWKKLCPGVLWEGFLQEGAQETGLLGISTSIRLSGGEKGVPQLTSSPGDSEALRPRRSRRRREGVKLVLGAHSVSTTR